METTQFIANVHVMVLRPTRTSNPSFWMAIEHHLSSIFGMRTWERDHVELHMYSTKYNSESSSHYNHYEMAGNAGEKKELYN